MAKVFVRKDDGGKVVEVIYGSISPGSTYKLLDETAPEVVAFTTPAPSPFDVGRERDRRLAAGFSYDFGDARGVHVFATSDDDMKRWSEVALGAQALINLGQPEGAIQIATQTGQASVTATEFQHIMLAAMQFRQPLYQKSFALQAMKPIPADFREDKYW